MTSQARRRKGSRNNSYCDQNNNVVKKQPGKMNSKKVYTVKYEPFNEDKSSVKDLIQSRKMMVYVAIFYLFVGTGIWYMQKANNLAEIPPPKDIDPQKISNSLPKTIEGNKTAEGNNSIEELLPTEQKIIANVVLPTPNKTRNTSPSNPTTEKEERKSRFHDFQVNIQNHITPSAILTTSGQIKRKWKEMTPKNNITSSVRVFIMDDFLSSYECDGLMRAHNNHVMQHEEHDPVVCFNSEQTMKQYLAQTKVPWANKVNGKDFMRGTYCLNETLSAQLNGKLSWSSSTSFYPGESKFSTIYEKKVQQHTGFDARNGGKLQVTSYNKGVGYKLHTDCTEGSLDPRDRYSTILVYLHDVEKGGETVFTELGIKVKPKKGRALIWNNMDSEGNCDLSSYHRAMPVKKGKKYILQRWYYYQNFPMLGKRSSPPNIPVRSHKLTPRVTCDEFESGSCRWYDEWNFDHLTDYGRDQAV